MSAQYFKENDEVTVEQFLFRVSWQELLRARDSFDKLTSFVLLIRFSVFHLFINSGAGTVFVQ